jgi:hypothetical protein
MHGEYNVKTSYCYLGAAFFHLGWDNDFREIFVVSFSTTWQIWS